MSSKRYLSNYFFLDKMICDFDILLYIGTKTKLFGKLKKSTVKISKELGIPQQTISRKIKDLEKKDYIEKKVSLKGIEVSLKQKGIEFLRKRRETLNSIFEESDSLKGRVFTGFMEGRYYMKNYKKKLMKILDFEPYEGTLNIMTDAVDMKRFISTLKKTNIKEFLTKQRTFGELDCYSGILVNDKIKAAIVVPVRSKYDEDVAEVIAPVCLRKVLKIKDDDPIKITRVI